MYIFLAPFQVPDQSLSTELKRLNYGMDYVRQIMRFNPELDDLGSRHFLGFEKPNQDSWEIIEPGDLILLHDTNRVIAIGYIALKRESESLSRALWPKNKVEPYILILKDTVGAALGISKLRDIVGDIELRDLAYLQERQISLLRQKYRNIPNFISLIADGEPLPEINIESPQEGPTPSNQRNPEQLSAYDIQNNPVTISHLPQGEETTPEVSTNKQIAEMDVALTKEGFAEKEARASSEVAPSEQDFREDQVKEMLRIAKLFEAATPKDLASLDNITRSRSVEQIVQGYSERNTNKVPEVVSMQVGKLKRDIGLVRALKALYDNKCQICGFQIVRPDGHYYSEAAHVEPISTRKAGVDTPGNILILCPNHHKMLDYGLVTILSPTECTIDGVKQPIRHIDYENVETSYANSINDEYRKAQSISFSHDKDGNVTIAGSETSPKLSQEQLNKAAKYVSKNAAYWPKGRGRK
jgi:HNH endonuclease